EHRRERLEMHRGRLGEEPRDGRLAAAGWPPEDHRGEAMLRHHAADGALRSEQVILPHHLGELLRPELVGERSRGLVLEKAHAQPRTGGVFRSLSSRFTVTTQGARVAFSSSRSWATLSTGRSLSAMMMSPASSPSCSAMPPSARSVMMTPRAVLSRPSSSANAGLRLATVAPDSGLRPPMRSGSRGGTSGGVTTVAVTSCWRTPRH